ISAGKNLSAWYNVASVYASQPRLMDLYLRGRPPVPGTKSIFVCPSTKGFPVPNPPTVAKPYFMYGFNNRMDPNDPPEPAPPLQFRLSEVLKPSDTVIFTENSESRFPSTYGSFVPGRHEGRANLGFVDGHAAPVHSNDYRLSAGVTTASA